MCKTRFWISWQDPGIRVVLLGQRTLCHSPLEFNLILPSIEISFKPQCENSIILLEEDKMIIRKVPLALGAALVLGTLGHSLSPSDIPSDTPISSLLASAKAHLASGQSNDALTYYDAAVSRDPENYLTIFQRGATYLSLGKNALANQDFNRVLAIKPDFEGALLQRANIKSRSADWDSARRDYIAAGKSDGVEYEELLRAEEAATAAFAAEKAGDWEKCVGQAGVAIMVGSTALDLRQLRARCRFERGEVQEGVSDLQHVLQIAPGMIDPHLQISSSLFYSLGDTEKGLAAIRKCLHSDPDSKPCTKLHRQEKKLDKQLKKIHQLKDKRQFNNAVKLLVGGDEETGLMDLVKEDIKDAKADGMIHKNSPNDFYGTLVEMTCEFYVEVSASIPFLESQDADLCQMNNKRKAAPYCEENLQLNPNSLPALLFKAQRQLDADDFEPAIHTLNHAKEHHPSSPQIGALLQKAHAQLKRSRTKDYYKVLEVARDADERTIKRAYRTLIKKHHPDKAAAQGLAKEASEKKMAAINEAYEVLSDPVKRAQVDRGDDPNSPDHQGSPFQGSPFGGGGGGGGGGQQFFFQSGGGQRFFQQGGFPGAGGGGFPFGGM